MAYGVVSALNQDNSNVYLADVSEATAAGANQQISLVWSDPADVELNGIKLATWDKTLVVRKAGSVPADYTDGTIVAINTTKDQYKTTPFVDTGLTNGTVYYYRFFPVSKDGHYTKGSTVSAKPSALTLPIPTVTSTHTYTGQSQSPTISGFDDSKMTKTGDESGTDAGEYEIEFALTDDNYIWSNGQYTPQTVSWSIAKAAGVVSLSKANTNLTRKVTTEDITITQTGDGVLSVENSVPTIASGVLSGNTLTISRVGTNVGSTTIRVKAAESNNYTAAQAEIVVTTTNYSIMTVKIDESNSNPETCCTYADDAVGMTPGSAEWDEFFGHYPCLLSGGVEGVKLNPNNFDQDVDGNAVTINSGDNDVMIAFPRHGLKMSKSGDIVTISMTDKPDDSNFEYMAHKRGSTLKDKFYLGAYMGSEVSSKLRSLKGQTIANNKKIGEFRTLARANSPASNGSGGSGYDQHGWYQLVYLQAMYVLKYKNLNSQSAVGQGYTKSSNTAQKATGGTETKGMDWGETTGKDHMKLFGIEDFWANVSSWIDGIWSDGTRKIWTATENFNDTGSGYTNRGSSRLTANKNGCLSRIQGDTHKAFLIGSDSGVSGSYTTYFTDYSNLYESGLLLFGGTWNGGVNAGAGAFCSRLSQNAAYAGTHVGSRLMYL